VIGWDGADHRVVEDMLARGELPNLLQLSDSGRNFATFENPLTTVTSTGWATIGSGYSYKVTRVLSNSDYDSIPPSKTWLERLHWRGFRSHLISGKCSYTGTQPGEPWYNASLTIDYAVSDHINRDQVQSIFMEKLDEALASGQRFAFLTIFATPDSTGHKYGSRSQEYRDSIAANDALIPQVLAKLAAAGQLEKTFIAVCSDHGFQIEGNDSKWDAYSQYAHNYASWGIVANNAYAISGDRILITDLAPTIYEALGITDYYTRYKPWLQGRSFAAVVTPRTGPGTGR
jgi:predicted AlkP superfamily pyrophosphatase or phosphodiesterase